MAYTIALTPYIILTASVLRAAFVTKRTPVMAPFAMGSDYDLSFDSDVLHGDFEP